MWNTNINSVDTVETADSRLCSGDVHDDGGFIAVRIGISAANGVGRNSIVNQELNRFAGTFAKRFADTADAPLAFGTNLLGAILGGCLEYLSLVFGYRALLVIAAVVYVVAFLIRPREKQPDVSDTSRPVRRTPPQTAAQSRPA